MPSTVRRWAGPALAVALALLTASCAELTHLPTLSRKDLRFHPPQSSFVYDAGGSLLTSFHGEQNRTVVPLKKIPKRVENAVVAIEDARFYEHNGVDVRAIVRALVANLRSGGVEEGGSTITQQYVKNVIIAPGETAAQTLRRKIDEAALSRQLENELSKREILERYLNTVYFGEGAYGIQAAARTYFRRPASRLTLGQGALLAGIIQTPGDYNPFEHPKKAKARRNLVLDRMVDLGFVSERGAKAAARKGLGLRPPAEEGRYPAPYFVDYVKRILTYDPRFKMLGDTPDERQKRLFTGGLRIYTTLDGSMQSAAEEAVQSVLAYPTDPHGAMVAVDPHNGHIKSMVGGRDYFQPRKKDRFAKLNLAILAEPNAGPKSKDPVTGKKVLRAPGTGRQAGSAFKPFALAAALEDGLSLAETYDSGDGGCMTFPTADNGGPWPVCNYEEATFGTISLLSATINSVNVVYAQLIMKVGAQAVVDVARAMGIQTPLLPVNSAVLGTNAVNALDMASAYATLAAGGVYHPPVAVTRIFDTTRNKTIYEDRSKSRVAISPAVAYITTTALERVVQEGTGAGALGYLGGRPAAGKTGTAQEYRDAWFAGYTPDLAAAVWVGYPEGSITMDTSCYGYTTPCRLTRIRVAGGTWPTQIWGSFMARALVNVPFTSFTKPASGIVAVTIDIRTGCLAGEFTPDEFRTTSYFSPGTQPTATCFVPGDKPKKDKEKETATVPSVLGMTREAAVAVLENQGFEVDAITEAEDNPIRAKARAGRVWKQSPSSSSSAEEGATVTIWVNPERSG